MSRFTFPRKIGRIIKNSGIYLHRFKHSKCDIFKNTIILNESSRINEIIQGEPKVTRAILENTEVTRNHMTPEIKLFLLTPNCSLYRMPYDEIFKEEKKLKRNVFLEPYWSIYWPGGQTLTRFILDEGRKLLSRSDRILDVGAGCGASSIASKLVGADNVIANDIDKVACIAIHMNAGLNNVDVKVSSENLLNAEPNKSTNVIFIGDMLYSEEIACVLIPWLEKAYDNGTRIYLGDPGRHGLTKDLKKRLKTVKRYRLPKNVQNENYGYDSCDIWQFCG